MTLKNR